MFIFILYFTKVIANDTEKQDENLLFIIQRLSDYHKRYNLNCGMSWKEEYKLFHKKELSQHSPKILVAVPHLSGFADRVIGFTTVFMISILTNRAIQISNRGLLPPLNLAFHFPNIHFNRKEDEPWLIEPLKHKASVRNYNESVLESKKYFAVNTLDDFRLQDRLLRGNLTDILGGSNIETVLMVTNRGKTIRMFENQNYVKYLTDHMGLNPSTAFGCLANYLIQPKPKIFLSAFSEFSNLTNPDPSVLKIAIQIRTGDSSLENIQHSIDLWKYSAFFSCAEQIENFAFNLTEFKFTKAIWYLATDSLPLRKAALEKYGNKIITNLNIKLEHSARDKVQCLGGDCPVSDEGFRMAVAEWWMQSFAHYHVISEYSGYGRSAAMLTLNASTIYTIRYKMQSKFVQCDPKTFTDLENLAYDWSGI